MHHEINTFLLPPLLIDSHCSLYVLIDDHFLAFHDANMSFMIRDLCIHSRMLIDCLMTLCQTWISLAMSKFG